MGSSSSFSSLPTSPLHQETTGRQAQKVITPTAPIYVLAPTFVNGKFHSHVAGTFVPFSTDVSRQLQQHVPKVQALYPVQQLGSQQPFASQVRAEIQLAERQSMQSQQFGQQFQTRQQFQPQPQQLSNHVQSQPIGQQFVNQPQPIGLNQGQHLQQPNPQFTNQSHVQQVNQQLQSQHLPPRPMQLFPGQQPQPTQQLNQPTESMASSPPTEITPSSQVQPQQNVIQTPGVAVDQTELSPETPAAIPDTIDLTDSPVVESTDLTDSPVMRNDCSKFKGYMAVGTAPPIPDSEQDPRILAKRELLKNVDKLVMAKRPEYFHDLKDNVFQSVAFRKVTPETSPETICDNLRVNLPPASTSWSPKMLPEEKTFPSVEEAVFYAMIHALLEHYQLVPRFDKETDTWSLHCDRMCADEIDRLERQQYADRRREYHNSQLGMSPDDEPTSCKCDFLRVSTTRKSCEFKLLVKKEGDAYVLKHTQNSIHSHIPSCHPSAHADASELLCRTFTEPIFENDNVSKEEYHRLHPHANSRSMFDYTPRPSTAHLTKLKTTRLGGKHPYEVLPELLKNPLLRGTMREGGTKPGSIFFAHTEGQSWWRAYPEVVVIDDTWERIPRGDATFRAITIRAISNTQQMIPVCVCLTEKLDPAFTNEDVWIWTLEHYRRLLDEFNVPYPSFIQSHLEERFLSACKKIFPESFVHLSEGKSPYKLVKDLKVVAKKYLFDVPSQKDAIEQWVKVIEARDEVQMNKQLQLGRIKSPQFFAHMERECLALMSEALKSKQMHFHLKKMSVLPMGWETYNAANIVELVRDILKSTVDCYEDLAEEYGKMLAVTKPGYSEFFDNVIHIISYDALRRVRDAPRAREGFRDCFGVQGYPCPHDIRDIKAQGRKLHVDDFHPHRRNIFADMYRLPKAGGTYFNEWNATSYRVNYRPAHSVGFEDLPGPQKRARVD
ncbi:hypothetical protein CJU89_4354 [Yarrowia sp. B02]|nr:hypothetical protein CJU89_4354 [Yarrowia sp. B02]